MLIDTLHVSITNTPILTEANLISQPQHHQELADNFSISILASTPSPLPAAHS